MLNLRPIEAQVLEGIKAGKPQRQLAAELGVTKLTITNITARLREMSAIKMNESKRYDVLETQYTITNMGKGFKRAEAEKVEIDEEVGFYIRCHYSIFPRSRIAKKLGIPKTKFNLMVLQLGIGE